MTFVFLDTETTGLDPAKHQVWEAAYAVDDGPVEFATLTHTIETADPAALHFNNYVDRVGTQQFDMVGALKFEGALKAALQGATIVGANPAFDAAFLKARWGETPWHYRLLDVESFAMPILGYDKPQGLHTITEDLRARGFDIYKADHTARADVLALRDAFDALCGLSREGDKQDGAA